MWGKGKRLGDKGIEFEKDRDLEKRWLNQRDKGSGFEKGRHWLKLWPTEREQGDKGSVRQWPTERRLGKGLGRRFERPWEFESKWGKELGRRCERPWARLRQRQILHRRDSGRGGKSRGRNSPYQRCKLSHKEDQPDRCWRSIESKRS